MSSSNISQQQQLRKKQLSKKINQRLEKIGDESLYFKPKTPHNYNYKFKKVRQLYTNTLTPLNVRNIQNGAQNQQLINKIFVSFQEINNALIDMINSNIKKQNLNLFQLIKLIRINNIHYIRSIISRQKFQYFKAFPKKRKSNLIENDFQLLLNRYQIELIRINVIRRWIFLVEKLRKYSIQCLRIVIHFIGQSQKCQSEISNYERQ